MDSTLLLDEKTNEILDKIENYKLNNKNTFLLNLWKNYILNRKKSYLQTLEDCNNFLNTSEGPLYNDIQYETIILLRCLCSTMNV